MENKPPTEKTETKLLKIMLPEELLERVQSYCNEKDMTVKDFVTDAIIEKLNLVYKERRKKGRM
jgi:NRPS condensation-like uncharacterized protein